MNSVAQSREDADMENARAKAIAQRILDVPKFFCVWAFEYTKEDFTLRGVFSERQIADELLSALKDKNQTGVVFEETQQQIVYRLLGKDAAR